MATNSKGHTNTPSVANGLETGTPVERNENQEVNCTTSAKIVVIGLELHSPSGENSRHSVVQNGTHLVRDRVRHKSKSPPQSPGCRMNNTATDLVQFSVEESSMKDQATSQLEIGFTGPSVSMYTAAGIRCSHNSHPNVESYRSELVTGHKFWLYDILLYEAPTSNLLIEESLSPQHTAKN